MLKRLGVSVLTLAVGLAVAPRLSAQSAPQRLVCKDGMITTTARGALACFGHGGIDEQATIQSQRGRYGVYPNTGTGQTRGVYGGSSTTSSNRGIYDRADQDRQDRNRDWDRRRERDRDYDRDHDHDRDHDNNRRDHDRGSRDRNDNGSRNGIPGRYDNRR